MCVHKLLSIYITVKRYKACFMCVVTFLIMVMLVCIFQVLR